MILEQKILEITEMEILFVIIMVLVFAIIMLIIFLYSYMSSKLHRQYHKGYNKAKSDKVQYYSAIKEIIDNYEKIFLDLTKDGSNYVYKASTLELMLNFRKTLKDYYNN